MERPFGGNALLRRLLLASLGIAAGCGSTGIDINQVNKDQQPDGGGPTVTNPPPTGFTDPFGGAPAYAASGGGGDNSHHGGEACMQQGCHSAASGGHSEAPSFLIGGTVYQDYYGKVPAQGVEVRIVDGAGHSASAYSDHGGNFYIRASSSNGVTFPANVGARNATTERPMITPLSTASMGSCAQSPCHVAGGSPATTHTYYPIHVP